VKAVVTGGAGFIGSHLVDLLVSEGHSVNVVDNFATGRMENLQQHAGNPKVVIASFDICNLSELKDACNGADWIFHLAGLADIVPSIERPLDYFAANVQGTMNVLEAAKFIGAKKLVYAASSSCYGIPGAYPTPEDAPLKPEYPYALTKAMGEELVLNWNKYYRLPTISLRLFNVYGPRSRTTGAYGAVFGVFLAQKINGKPYTVVGDGSQTRDFTFVTDVARAFYQACLSQHSGIALNVGSGNHYSINYLVNLLGGSVIHLPKRPGEPDCTFADTRHIQQQIQWAPKVSFEDGVRMMVEHIELWRDAPVWDEVKIKAATAKWFEFLEKQ